MKAAKIVVLGGSGVATPALAAALAEIPGRTRPIELVLVGRSAEKLEKVTGVARLMVAQPSPGGSDPLLTITCATDAAAALSGAEIVLNQIRVGGLEARAFDESFPHEFGLPGEETVGPGGFANASRTIPTVLEYARLIEQICPAATLLTFANPSSLVHYAITRATRISTIGLCDGPVSLRQQVAFAAGVAPAEIWMDYVGMHHFGWVVGAWKDRQDVLPRVLENASIAAPEVDPAITRAIGAVPGPYFNYLYHPEKMLAKKMGKRTRAEELLDLQDELLAEFETALAAGQKPAGLARRKAKWYEAIIAPVMVALAEKRTQTFIVNVTNGQVIPWLPADAIIEVPVLFNAGRVTPLAVGPVPPEVKALIQVNCAYEMLAVEAIIERDRAKALRALLLNPIIRTYAQAAQTLEKAWAHAP